ncbi:hypothetical protein AGMMS50212_16800 [Spirochaetia bacterium]|nr:hypothetical protein AGMMS50212_16800 [Spirochaetia bacterium]
MADIETGKSWVSSLTLVKLANVLEINVYELFKPELTGDDVKDSMSRLVKNISVSFNKTLESIAKQYLA